MFFADIFNPKVVDHKGEGDWVVDVLPQAGRVEEFVVSLCCETLIKELVGEDAGLR